MTIGFYTLQHALRFGFIDSPKLHPSKFLCKELSNVVVEKKIAGPKPFEWYSAVPNNRAARNT